MTDGDEKPKYDESLARMRDSWLGLFGLGGDAPAADGSVSHAAPSVGGSQALMQEQFQALQNMMGVAASFAEPMRAFIDSQRELAEKMTQWAQSQQALAEVAQEWAESQRKLAETLNSWAAVQPFADGFGRDRT